MQLKLTVLYRTPSLNKTMRQHWAVQYKEKNIAWDALLGALKSASLCSESGVLIQTTPQPSTKNLLDGLRHAGLLPEDNPWTIKLQVEQEKVKGFDNEKTEIEINYPIDYLETIK